MRRGARTGLALAAALLVAAGALAATGAWLLHARPGGLPERVEVEIPEGAPGRVIVARLAEAGLVDHPALAYWYLRVAGDLAHVEAGTHELPGDANLVELAQLLTRPATLRRVVLTLIPGESVWQAADRLQATGLGTAEELLALASDHALTAATLDLPVGQPRPPRADGVPPTYLEGFLYPETYYFTPDAGVDAVVRRVTGEFQKQWARLRERRRADVLVIGERYGLKEHELITLASLVTREARRSDEAATIAGVFFNRLDRDMPLQTDPTLVYHPGKVGRPPTPDDRRDGSNPYNTYAHGGLPPGPICSPTRAALEAVLTPERHDYLYFVAKRDGRGSHAFARTYDEHKANVDRYLR